MKPCIPASTFCLLLLQLLLVHGAEPGKSVLAGHADDLVALRGEKLVPFDSGGCVKAPYTVLYFGAGWCPDCRRFSPALVDAYAHQAEGQKRFEVLLVSM